MNIEYFFFHEVFMYFPLSAIPIIHIMLPFAGKIRNTL